MFNKTTREEFENAAKVIRKKRDELKLSAIERRAFNLAISVLEEKVEMTIEPGDWDFI